VSDGCRTRDRAAHYVLLAMSTGFPTLAVALATSCARSGRPRRWVIWVAFVAESSATIALILWAICSEGLYG
jgi:hypothetical protein